MKDIKLIGLLGIAAALSNSNQTGRQYYPEPLTEKQKRAMEQDSKQIQQQHLFIIKGQKIWARNKKDALKQANKK